MDVLKNVLKSKRFIGAVVGLGIGICVYLFFYIKGEITHNYSFSNNSQGAISIICITLFGILGAYIAAGLDKV